MPHSYTQAITVLYTTLDGFHKAGVITGAQAGQLTILPGRRRLLRLSVQLPMPSMRRMRPSACKSAPSLGSVGCHGQVG